MKHLLKFGIALAFLLAGCSDGTGDEPNQFDGETIVCFGNSLTEGYGGNGKSYPYYLAQKINAEVVNLGVTGITAEEAVVEVKKHRVDFESATIIIIELGANDLIDRVFGDIDSNFVEEVVEKSFEDILDYIKSLNTNPKIYLAKFYNDEVAKSLFSLLKLMGYGFVHDEYEKMFDRLKKKYGVAIIEDIWAGIWGKYNLMYDEDENGRLDMEDIHPNADGYKIMADNYLKALRK
ncbi:MAG: GDSL-type esterase/lipase family protein [Fibromonadales bacterium]|nr:GDSL-type esterase/lipase family protein [Fibromonadales bacterium]